MRKISWLFMVLTVLSLAIYGCSKSDKGKTKDTSKVLATVNGENVTENDLIAELGGKPESFQKMASTPEGKQMMTERLVERKLLMQEAKAEGLIDTPEIEKKLQVYRERLVVEELRKKVMGDAGSATDQDLQKYYEEHKAQFGTAEMVRVRRIVMLEKTAAEKIQKELKADPAKFAETAKASSQDEYTRNRGGDMGFVMKYSDAKARMRNADPSVLQKNTIPDALATTVFAMNVNEISPVLESDGKYYIYQVVDKRAAESKSFNDVKEQLRRAVEYEGIQAKWKEFIEGLKKEAKITYSEDLGGGSGAGKPEGK